MKVICGSMRYKKEMMKVTEELALKGYCILTPMYQVTANIEINEKQKELLKNEHFKRIEMSDAILALNIDYYIGESTKLEIDYAKKLNKQILYYTEKKKNKEETKMILIGEKDVNKQYYFRETVFGICLKNEKLYLTKKGEDISLIGGGLELNETEETTLKREALEEAGLEIIAMNKICDIDCYWKTRDNRDIESLTHIYRIEISDKIIEPLELESKLVKMSINEAKNQLKLPYHKQGLIEFLNKIK